MKHTKRFVSALRRLRETELDGQIDGRTDERTLRYTVGETFGYSIHGLWSDVNPCGGGVEYLHREPASRKRRRNGTKNAAP
jgi:hypothetical protein